MLIDLKDKINNHYEFRSSIHSDYDRNNLIFHIREEYPLDDNTIDFHRIKAIISFIKETTSSFKIVIKNSIQVYNDHQIILLNLDNCIFLERVYFEDCTFKR